MSAHKWLFNFDVSNFLVCDGKFSKALEPFGLDGGSTGKLILI